MNPHQELRATIELQARGKLRLLDVLANEGMEVSRLSVAPGLSTNGVLLDVLVYVPASDSRGVKPRGKRRKAE